MIRAIKGTKDLYGAEMVKWRKMEDTIREVCAEFCIGEIRTPVFEHTELFVRGVGDTTDIVQKEMYTFEDKGGRSITLKPEVTASVVRAFIEHSFYADAQPKKLFYISPCFRSESPQKGRLRQFHQFGAEYFGAYGPAADAEMIALGHAVIKRLGINTTLYINSLGGNQCRAKYNGVLKNFLRENLDSLCPTCQERYERNPLRVLDCKDPGCQALLENCPSTIDTLDKECAEHFDSVMNLLGAMGVNPVVNPKMVRGLDYYTRTVFGFVSNDIGAQSSVCGGGRYDNLMEEFDGPAMGGVGFAMGIERLMMAAPEEQDAGGAGVGLYIGAMGGEGLVMAHKLAMNFRNKGVSVEADLMERGVKAQLKYANKIGARYSVVIGDEELASGRARVKNMDTGAETERALDDIYKVVLEGERK